MNCSFCLKIISLVAAGIAVCDLAAAESYLPSRIVVIKDGSTKPVKSAEVDRLLELHEVELNVYDIDAVDGFESRINQLLPGDESKAKLAFEEYLNRTGRETFEKDAVHAYQGIMAAVRYELKKYPVIIFDGSSVIYGVTDMDEALSRYQNWKAAKEGEQ